MKTLIINGSPRENGDTSFLLKELRSRINSQVIEIRAYDNKISPCIDCRKCQKIKGCVIDDDMKIIYNDDFDNVVIASPLYMSNLTAPLMAIASRFQAYYCAKRFLKDEITIRQKKSALIIVGGGDGSADDAKKLSKWMFKKMNAEVSEKHCVFSLRTDEIPTKDDGEAISKIHGIADYFNFD